MKIKQYQGWKHYEKRPKDASIKYLVVHCFALSVEEMIADCDKRGVGAHYLIDEAGNVAQFVKEEDVAWHAGKSQWLADTGLNKFSIGIELQNKTLGQTPFPAAQMKAFEELALDIMRRHQIRPENVVGHSDIAPTRKADPNVCFPWEEMAKKGIGVWPKANAKARPTRERTNTLLKKIGYDIANPKAALWAFLRHFCPEYLPYEPDVFQIEADLLKNAESCPKADKKIRACLTQVAAAYACARKQK